MSHFLLGNFEQRPLYLSLLATARTPTTLTLAATMVAIRAPVAGRVAQCKLPACIYTFHAITTRLFRTRAGAHSLVEPDSTACLVVSRLAITARGVATSIGHIHHPCLAYTKICPHVNTYFKAQIGDGPTFLRRGTGRYGWLSRLSRQKPPRGECPASLRGVAVRISWGSLLLSNVRWHQL